MKNANEVKQLIDTLDLQPHPEGGFYRRITFLDGIISSIYYLITHDQFSAWHKIKHANEMMFFHRGSAVRLYMISPNGELTETKLGDVTVDKEAVYQKLVPADHWMAYEIIDKDAYTLLSAAVAPSFDFKHWVLAKRHKLIQQYPQYKEVITRLTRTV